MSEQVRMTLREIALMRQIIAWHKAEGVEFRKNTEVGTRRWVNRRQPFATRRMVWVDIQTRAVCPMLGSSGEHWIEVDSVTEGVDILVAKGYLPKRFSSAYASGWEARHEAATVACRDGMGQPGWDSLEVAVLTPAARG